MIRIFSLSIILLFATCEGNEVSLLNSECNNGFTTIRVGDSILASDTYEIRPAYQPSVNNFVIGCWFNSNYLELWIDDIEILQVKEYIVTGRYLVDNFKDRYELSGKMSIDEIREGKFDATFNLFAQNVELSSDTFEIKGCIEKVVLNGV